MSSSWHVFDVARQLRARLHTVRAVYTEHLESFDLATAQAACAVYLIDEFGFRVGYALISFQALRVPIQHANSLTLQCSFSRCPLSLSDPRRNEPTIHSAECASVECCALCIQHLSMLADNTIDFEHVNSEFQRCHKLVKVRQIVRHSRLAA